jgi:PAS domain S-box-containing protein
LNPPARPGEASSRNAKLPAGESLSIDTLRPVVNALDQAVVIADAKGRITLFNPAADALYGSTLSSLLGHEWIPDNIYLPDKTTRCPKEKLPLWQAVGGETVQNVELYVRNAGPDGGRWISVTGRPLLDQGGKLQGAMTVARDVTQLKGLIESERQARGESSTEKRFRKLLEAAPDGILEVNADGKIVLVNQAAERMFGYTRDELLALNVEALVPAAMRGDHHRHRHAYAASPQTRPMGTGLELKAQRKDGSLFPVEISLSPNWTDGVMYVIALIRDISERKESEDRLRAVREQYTAELAVKNRQLELRNREVEKANRLKSEFLASMSHELRTPLHTIIGFSELLTEETEGPLNPKQKRFLGHVLQDSRHLLELINEVLDISKIEAGRLELQCEAFNFAECVVEVFAGIEQRARAKDLRLENRNTFKGLLYADRLRIKEVLYNLLSNAVKFTPEGGSIWLDASQQEESLHITVSDTGVGISEEEQEAIFEKFYQAGTTSGLREGTGLGLPITRKLIELHGGKIRVESSPGKGSRFIVILPVAGQRDS